MRTTGFETGPASSESAAAASGGKTGCNVIHVGDCAHKKCFFFVTDRFRSLFDASNIIIGRIPTETDLFVKQ